MWNDFSIRCFYLPLSLNKKFTVLCSQQAKCFGGVKGGGWSCPGLAASPILLRLAWWCELTNLQSLRRYWGLQFHEYFTLITILHIPVLFANPYSTVSKTWSWAPVALRNEASVVANSARFLSMSSARGSRVWDAISPQKARQEWDTFWLGAKNVVM
jgi:hypothetical protein